MQNTYKDYGPIPGYHSHVPDSCNEEDAIRYLMFWGEKIILPFYKLPEHYKDDDLEFYNSFSIANVLRQELENAEAEYRESKYNNLAAEIQVEKLASLEEKKLISSKYYTYRSHLTDELAKLEKSALRIDQAATTNQKTPFITTISLFEWANEISDISVLDEIPTVKNMSPNAIQEPKRADPMRAEIMRILSTMQNPIPGKVMAALKERAGTKNCFIIGDIGYGVKWINNNNETVELNMKALGERIRNLKKPR